MQTEKELDCGDGKGIACVWVGDSEQTHCKNCLRAYADRLFDRIAYGETRARVAHALGNSSYGNERDAVRGAMDAVNEWATQTDPRPDDMAELARLTAIELRKRGIWSKIWGDHIAVPRWDCDMRDGALRPCFGAHSLLRSDFDNLGPIACADVIQAEESRRAQEWAGDA